MLRLRRPPSAVLERLLANARAETPTYTEIGATQDGALPAGYRHDRYEAALGRGGELFDGSIRALRGWQAQRGAGVEVVPADAWVAEGETVLLLIRVGALEALAPCRVIYVLEEPRHFSFAYGTLPGHPEQGEVAFSIHLDTAENVSFRIVSFSRTVDPLARLGSPLTRQLQKRVTRGYVKALQDAAH